MRNDAKPFVALLVLFSFLCLAPLSTPTPLLAQTSNPLMEMLAFVPDIDATGFGRVEYVDYRAVEAGRRSLVVSPENREAFLALDEAERDLWQLTMGRVWAAREPLYEPVDRIEMMPETVGFDFFDIDRALVFGQFPNQGRVYGGNFDIESIRAAHVARGYTQEDMLDIEVWCASGGCDGYDTNVDNVEPGNVFEPGSIGRQPPFAILPGNLATAYGLDTFLSMLAAHTDPTLSLAENPAYRILTQSITDPATYSGSLVQAIFVSSAVFPVADYSAWTTQDEVERALRGNSFAPEMTGYGALPPFSLVALADRQEGFDQLALVALVCDDLDDARTAASEMTNRLMNFTQESQYGTTRPVLSYIDGAVVEKPRAYQDSATGLAVAIASVRYPLPMSDVDPGITVTNEPRPYTGYLFGRWMVAYGHGTFYPLWQVILPDWLREDT